MAQIIQSDVIQQVAEEKCPACGDTMNPGGNPYFSIGGNEMPDGSDCPDCQGTGLRWPPLSRECNHHAANFCALDWVGCSGRIPDVTLEGVLDCFDGDTAHFHTNDDGTFTFLSMASRADGTTRLEAACAALLASVEAT